MIADALRRTVFRTPEQVIAESLANARRRLPVGCRVIRTDGAQGTLTDIVTDRGMVEVVVVTDDNLLIREMPGWWSRSSL